MISQDKFLLYASYAGLSGVFTEISLFSYIMPFLRNVFLREIEIVSPMKLKSRVFPGFPCVSVILRRIPLVDPIPYRFILCSS